MARIRHQALRRVSLLGLVLVVLPVVELHVKEVLVRVLVAKSRVLQQSREEILVRDDNVLPVLVVILDDRSVRDRSVFPVLLLMFLLWLAVVDRCEVGFVGGGDQVFGELR